MATVFKRRKIGEIAAKKQLAQTGYGLNRLG